MLDSKSLDKLQTCDKRLINLVMVVAARIPLKVIDGFRNEAAQMAAFNANPKKSQQPWPESKHNKIPSLAIDIVPLEKVDGKEFIDWNDRERMTLIAGLMLNEAYHQGINLRWGGDWNGDYSVKDNKFDDLPHFEITEV